MSHILILGFILASLQNNAVAEYRMATFWGARPTGHSPTLKQLCESQLYNYIVVGFVKRLVNRKKEVQLMFDNKGFCKQEPNRKLGAKKPSYKAEHCLQNLKEDLEICEGRGKKVFISIGGPKSWSKIESGMATKIADKVYETFFQGNFSIDGVDLELADRGGKQPGFASFVSHLRGRMNSNPERGTENFISMTTNCRFPNAILRPEDMITESMIDLFIVKVFGSSCGASHERGMNATVENWLGYVEKLMNPTHLEPGVLEDSNEVPRSVMLAVTPVAKNDDYKPSDYWINLANQIGQHHERFSGFAIWNSYQDEQSINKIKAGESVVNFGQVLGAFSAVNPAEDTDKDVPLNKEENKMDDLDETLRIESEKQEPVKQMKPKPHERKHKAAKHHAKEHHKQEEQKVLPSIVSPVLDSIVSDSKPEIDALLTASGDKTSSVTVDPETGKPLAHMATIYNAPRGGHEIDSPEVQKQNYAHYLARLQSYRSHQQLNRGLAAAPIPTSSSSADMAASGSPASEVTFSMPVSRRAQVLTDDMRKLASQHAKQRAGLPLRPTTHQAHSSPLSYATTSRDEAVMKKRNFIPQVTVKKNTKSSEKKITKKKKKKRDGEVKKSHSDGDNDDEEGSGDI